MESGHVQEEEVPELHRDVIEELGLLLHPKEISAARATCRSWRHHLSQRVATQPGGRLFELVAQVHVDVWEKRVQSMMALLPAVREVRVIAGGRVLAQAFEDVQLPLLAAAQPSLQGLDLVYLSPPAGLFSSLEVGEAAAAKLVAFPLPPVPPIPRGLSAFTSLRRLSITAHDAPARAEMSHLPSTLTHLRLMSGLETHGLLDLTLAVLGGHVPSLTVLDADVAPFCVTAVGLAGLPRGLQRLQLFGLLALGREEVQVLCTHTPELRHLTLEIPSDQHAAAEAIMTRHPRLATLDLRLNQEEAEHDPTFGEVAASLTSQLDTSPPSPADTDVPVPVGSRALRTSAATGPVENGVGAQPGAAEGSVDAAGLPVHDVWAEEDEPAAWRPHRRTRRPVTGPDALVPGVPEAVLRRPDQPVCRLTALVLQSIKLVPSQHTCRQFLTVLSQLTSLTSLTIAEPWVAGGDGSRLQGSLACLSRLQGLTALTVALMPGFPIPALHFTPEVLRVLGAACTGLARLEAWSSMDFGGSASHSSHLSLPTQLTALMMSPIPHAREAMPSASERTLRTHSLPTLSLAHLPPKLDMLALTGYCLTGGGTDGVAARLGGLRDLVLSMCELAADMLPAGPSLFSHCSALQSLMLRHVSGLDDAFLSAEPLPFAAHLTSLQLSAATALSPELTQRGLLGCARLTALRTLHWETSASAQERDEPQLVRAMAVGPKGLHGLRLGMAAFPDVRAVTRQVVAELLPLCCLATT